MESPNKIVANPGSGWKNMVVGAAIALCAMNARECVSPAQARELGDLQSVVDQLQNIARAIERTGRCR